MATPSAPSYATDFNAETGKSVEVVPGLVRVTAPNASAYTFTGTNSFLIGHERLALVDPGPLHAMHEEALLAAIAGRPVAAIILTHTHVDHSAAAGALSQKLGAPLWFGGRHRLSRPLRLFEFNSIQRSCDWKLIPDRHLRDDEIVAAGDRELSVHATPGHCANHLAFGLVGTDVLLTGDHVMGWNSTLVSVPDGSMADYLASLDKVIALPYRRYAPAHGGVIADGLGHATALAAHRRFRNQQVVEAVRAGAKTPRDIVDVIYPQQPAKVRLAALMTISAHIEYLESRGELRVRRGWLRTRLSLS